MKKSKNLVELWYRCALVPCGILVLINLHDILDSASFFNPTGPLFLLLYGLAVFYVFQKNRGCQLAGWICSSFYGIILFFEGLNVLLWQWQQLRMSQRLQEYRWSKGVAYDIDHHSQHLVLAAVMLAVFVAVLVPSIWLLIRELKRLMREDDEARTSSESHLDEILSAPTIKVEKARVPKSRD